MSRSLPLAATSRICTRCGADKPFAEFRRRSNNPYGVGERCRECARAVERTQVRTRSQAGRVKRRSGERERCRKYGVTPCQITIMRIATGDRCQVCSLLAEPVCIDHDHTTGRVRGLLCRACNLGIGHLGDDLERVSSAARYLANA